MKFCPVDNDIRNYSHQLGLEAGMESAIESRAESIFCDFLYGESEIDEQMTTWFEEEGKFWDLVKIIKAHRKGSDLVNVLEMIDKLFDEVEDKANEFAMEQAQESVK